MQNTSNEVFVVRKIVSLDLLEGINVNSPDRRLIKYPWGMHICYYQQKKDTRPVLRRGMPSAVHVKNNYT